MSPRPQPEPGAVTPARRAIVTGGGAGLGQATAIALARAGCTVTIVERDVAVGAPARAAVAAASGRDDVDLVTADLGSQAAVRALATTCLDRCPRIDILVNNAGVIPERRMTTPEGLERQLAVNHLAPFLLTALLRDRLVASAPSRVVTVTSVAHHLADPDFDPLDVRGRYRPLRRYAWTKLANVLFTYELARRLAGTGVTANCGHPGLARTALLRAGTPVWLRGVTWRLGVDPARGARTAIHLATSDAVADVSGRYYWGTRARRSSGPSYNESRARSLWALSGSLTGDPW